MTAPDLVDTRGAAAPQRWSRAAWIVVLLGAAYAVLAALLGDRSGSSVLWPLDLLLMLVFAGGLWWRGCLGWDARRRLSRRGAAVAFIIGSWLTAMLYELSLRTGATGFGGLHANTATSFLLAQGFYVPLAVGGWLLARRYGYSAEDVFWTGALAALYEMLTAGVVTLMGQPSLWPLAPLLGGYYLTVYGYCLALPWLFLDERDLWRHPPHLIARRRKVLCGLLLGPACWLVFVGWAWLVAWLG